MMKKNSIKWKVEVKSSLERQNDFVYKWKEQKHEKTKYLLFKLYV
jgi:hypothetical protein